MDIITKRHELVKRKLQLSKPPVITTRMRRESLSTRPKRQELAKYKKAIIKQKRSYEKQISDIDKYLKEKALINEEKESIEPRVSFFKHPKLVRTRADRHRWF